MEKSPCPGTPFSSKTSPEWEERIALLTSLVSTPIVSQLKISLGTDAGLFLVGGTVRDVLAGREGYDIDLASSLLVEEIERRLTGAGIRVIPTGMKHGTVTALVEGVGVEITSFRAQSTTSPCVEEDLLSRDFTINALAFDVERCCLLDPAGGAEDLRHGIIRGVRDPFARFEEDPLRLLRMVRFGPASGRTIDPATADAAKRCATSLTRVSVERIRSELDRIWMSSHPGDGLRALLHLGLLEFTIPELLPTVGFEQNRFHVHDVFEHTVAVLDGCPPDLILRWAAVFHDIGKAHTLSVDEAGNRHFYEHEVVSTEIGMEVMRRLRFSNDQMSSISCLVRLHMRPLDCGAPGVRRLIRDLGEEFERWRNFKRADKPPVYEDARVDEMLERFDALVASEKSRLKGSVYGRLAVTGDDLIALGIKPGKGLGQILKELESLVLDNPDANDREVLLARTREILARSTSN